MAERGLDYKKGESVQMVIRAGMCPEFSSYYGLELLPANEQG